MTVDVSTEITIDRPLQQVASFAADPTNAPRWYVNIESAQPQTPAPLRVGSTVVFVAHFLGKRLRYTYEVTEYVPEQRLVMRTAEGPFPMETSYTWRPVGGGTSMTLRNRGEPRGFSKLTAPLMGRAIRRANRADLAKLKALLEGGGS
ncbi:MAG TPA: SRPBCC family protein [Propionibacteriaceae bacterium]|nr:SRPBCC family protein [Propionibacteriaceae bacterium]